MADSITPVRVAALPFPAVRPRKRPNGIRIGLIACELLSLIALAAILAPSAGHLRWSGASRLLAGWPDLRDANAACQEFVRESDSLRARAPIDPIRDSGAWSWTRLDDGRFRILGYTDGRTRSGAVRRTRYQCDLAPLTSNGRWRVDSLVVSRNRVS
jgi:hypothetical protein